MVWGLVGHDGVWVVETHTTRILDYYSRLSRLPLSEHQRGAAQPSRSKYQGGREGDGTSVY